MALDVSALSDWIKENADEFFSKRVIGAKTNSFMQVMTDIKGPTKLPTLEADYDIFQDGSTCNDSVKGDIIIDQRLIDVAQILIREKVCLRDLTPSFMRQTLERGQTYEGLGKMENAFLNLVSSRLDKMIELASWNGIEGGASPLASLNLYDGLLEIISNEIALASIPVSQQINTAVTSGAVIETLESMRSALPLDQFDDPEDSTEWVLFSSGGTRQQYFEDYRSTFNGGTYNNEFKKKFIDGTQIEIVSVPGLFGTDKGLLTKRSNLWLSMDVPNEEHDFDVYMGEHKENAFFKSRFAIGYQIKFPSEVVTLNIA